MKILGAFSMGCLLLYSTTLALAPRFAFSAPQKNATPQLDDKQRHGHTTTLLADEVRHQLITLPYYGVFDWLEAQVLPDDSVVLRGEVTRDSTKSDAESRVRKLESVTKVVNQIEVLPALPNDDQIRRETYRAIFRFDGPLFQYAIRSVPPIHIIVKGGHVSLKGIVASDMDKQLAYTAAAGVPGTFEVKNELVVEK